MRQYTVTCTKRIDYTYANTMKDTLSTIDLRIQRAAQSYITASKPRHMLLTIKHLVRTIFNSIEKDDISTLRLYYDILSRIMKDNVVLALQQDLNDVIRMSTNVLITFYCSDQYLLR